MAASLARVAATRRQIGRIALLSSLLATPAWVAAGCARAPEPATGVAPAAPGPAESRNHRERRPTLEPGEPVELARQARDFDAHRPKSLLELQKFRRSFSTAIRGTGGRDGVATLIDIAPRINDWYVLHLAWRDGRESWHHLVNTRPEAQALELHPGVTGGIVIASTRAHHACELWSDEATACIEDVARGKSPWAALCGDSVLLRRPTAGARTVREWAADFLRDRVWGGEKLTVLVRNTLYGDAFLERGKRGAGPGSEPPPADGPGRPVPLRLAPGHEGVRLHPGELGIQVESASALHAGSWYAVAGLPGIWLSVVEPRRVAADIPPERQDRVRPLDDTERVALVYLVAFDLDRFELGFAVGTDHPRVGWSERVLPEIRDPALPGPDGFDRIAPLVGAGALPPVLAERVAATFVGGFKRQHGAFKWGPLSRVNAGSHYGFIESGAVLSRLQPGLSTLLVLDDGTVEMKSWARDDDQRLEAIRFARQNGVALVEREPSGRSVPGALVARWGDGNWSGSQDGKLRTLRSGACIQDGPGGRFLIYGYFSSATPSAMARVFLAAGCEHAMLLDMNALEHTYLALYRRSGGALSIQHLARGMSVLEKELDGALLPRFLGQADNRDFFYLLHREPAP